MVTFLQIAGGVALLVYGVRLLRKGLDRLFGSRLAAWLQRVSRNRLRGAAIGMGVAAVAPSSTTIALLGTQMVRAGTIGFGNLWSIMLGAMVGLTVMIQLVAFNILDYASIIILLGVVLFQGSRRSILRGTGQSLLAVGLIFLGIGIIQSSTGDIGQNEDLVVILGILSRYPWGLAALAMVICVMLQSSTATLGLLLGLTGGGLIGLEEALPCVVGANVGVGVTFFIFGRHHPESRRLGIAMLLSKISTAVLIMFLRGYLDPVLEWFSPDGLGRQIANAHTGFSILMTVIWLPLLPVASSMIERIIPDAINGDNGPGKAKYLREDYVNTPALAFGQSTRELIRMAHLVRNMLGDFWVALEQRNMDLCNLISKADDDVDQLNHEIKTYLTRLAGEGYGSEESATVVAHLRYSGELETIGDIIDKNLSELVRKLIRTGGYFTDEGYADLKQAYAMVRENFEIADTAFSTRDSVLAEKLVRHKRRLGRLDTKLREQHFDRLRQGLSEAVETSSIHLDILTYLKSINSHITAVAYPMLDQAGKPHPVADE